jgi:origin recognition complex subunit 3
MVSGWLACFPRTMTEINVCCSNEKIPSAFIITGPSISAQDLLFEQLSEKLQALVPSRFVTLKSSDAGNLKAVLKKIIGDVTARASGDEDDGEVAVSKDVSCH